MTAIDDGGHFAAGAELLRELLARAFAAGDFQTDLSHVLLLMN